MNENAVPRRSPKGILFFHALAILLLFSILIFVVPKCKAIFQDFDVDLPVITLWAVACSHIAVRCCWLLLPLVLVVDASVLLALTRLPPTRTGPATAWFVSVLLVVGLMIIVTVVAIGIPMTDLVDNLSSG